MNTKQKHGLLNKVIAILLVITMTCVYVVGDSYAPVIVQRNKHESTDLFSQTLSYSTDVVPNLELKDVSDLVLAKNTTNMGKASQSLSEAYANMPEAVKNSSELESSVSYFKEQIADLKAQSLKELIETDNGTEEFDAYKNAVTAGYTQLEEHLSGVNADNYEEIMADVSALINPERPYVSLADDLPFNDVSEDNISYSAYNPESVESYQIDDGSYSDDDLKQTNDTIINDDVIIICSEGDITIRSTDVDIKGIIYAPNGTVTIESNDFNIQGRIIAKNIIFQGSIFTGETFEGDLNLFY